MAIVRLYCYCPDSVLTRQNYFMLFKHHRTHIRYISWNSIPPIDHHFQEICGLVLLEPRDIGESVKTKTSIASGVVGVLREKAQSRQCSTMILGMRVYAEDACDRAGVVDNGAEAIWAQLGRLARLEQLHLDKSNLIPSIRLGMDHLKRLKQLRVYRNLRSA
ncbi:hypothetical protein BG011_009465 [Mortierella polycephala]|uniref:Uncharacterized protein n=1 Tax=Mortierella polycephala TaxID=41804 RepID=A0A9P6PMV1_9FUNG|nr:hypothetical protein BG011_009465 [Mortierella polycephala]